MGWLCICRYIFLLFIDLLVLQLGYYCVMKEFKMLCNFTVLCALTINFKLELKDWCFEVCLAPLIL